jgi:hypothetical protein
VVARLRADGSERPPVDPGLAGGLRDWLEDALADAVTRLPEAQDPVRVNKESLNQVLVCEGHLAACRAAPRVVTYELARGGLVDALFRQWITAGRIDDPWVDACAAVEIDGDPQGVLAYVGGLPTDAHRRLSAEVAEHAARVAYHWTALSPSWLPRTQERMVVPLCDGRVVLAGVADLVVGGPAEERASVCLVEVKSGARRLEHRGDLHLYALLETLRSGAPPFRIATFYTRTGELDDEPVGEDTLVAALQRVLTGSLALCRLAAGAQPTLSSNPLCAWCVGLPRCGPGRARAGTDVPSPLGDADDTCAGGDLPVAIGAVP